MALTIEQIHSTADQLQEQGIKPTLAEVRKALGGGSFTTISDAMQSWKREQKEEQELQQVELPSSVAERLQTLGADMWQTAIDIANDRLVKEREALEIIKTKAQAETAGGRAGRRWMGRSSHANHRGASPQRVSRRCDPAFL